MAIINTTTFSQLDPRWSGKFIGKTKQTTKQTIGKYGCAITSLCNLLSAFGYTETPDTFNKKMTANNGYLGALVIWSVVTKIWPNVRFAKRVRNYNNAEVAYYVYIKRIPVMCEVYNPQSPTRLHWVLLIGNRQLIDPLGGVIRPTSAFREYTGYSLYDRKTN